MEKSKMIKMNKKLYLCFLMLVVVFISVLVFINNRVYADWKEDEDGTRYELDNGENAVGFQEIDESLYYFNEDGYLQTGKFYIEDKDAYYYADEKGVIQYGVIKTDDAFYITDEEGKIKTGFVENDGKTYYFNKKATMLIGWINIDNDWYYTDENGELKTGFITVDGVRYYLEADGKRVSNTVMEIDGTTYIFSSDGSVDENATLLYPVYKYISNMRTNLGLSDVVLDTKIQACALLMVSGLKDGFVYDSDDNLEKMIKNRGIKISGGYEFSYGGLENYGIDQLLANMNQDDRFQSAIKDPTLNNVGIGILTEGNVNYFEIILVSEE